MESPRPPESTFPRGLALIFLLVAMLIGAWLRLVDLGLATMGADMMEFFKICQSGLTPSQLFAESGQYVGTLPPAWFAAHNALIQWLGLPVTFTTARLPDALMGIATIWAAFLLVRSMVGVRAGLVAAVVAAFQPLLVQMSRECYFYAPIVPGCLIALWALLRLEERLRKGLGPDWRLYIALFVGYYLITNIQISSWPFAAVFTLAIYAVVLLSGVSWSRKGRYAGILTACLFLIGLPSLLDKWGLRDVIYLAFGAGKDQWGDVLEQNIDRPWLVAWNLAASYLFGSGWLRGTVSLLVLITGVYALIRAGRSRSALRVFGFTALAALLMQALIHTLSIFPPTPRHYSSIFPVFIVLTALALDFAGMRLAGLLKRGLPGLVALLFSVAVVLACNAWPAWLATRLIGSPPYMAAARWMDTSLPSGTVVLCDRWFTPWNEFRINASTNVQFTYTIPNEPVQVYEQHNWRETAKEFFEINPLAAFFEGKEYWARLGPWTWPEEAFAHKKVFVDKAGIALERMGLHYRPTPQDFPVEWLPVTLYYNTEEDVVQQRRARGEDVLTLFGAGWKYTKTNDHRDWYMLEEAGVLTVYNLREQPISVRLRLLGTALNAPKILTLDGGRQRLTFQANQLQQVVTAPLTLNSGKNEWRLQDVSKTSPKPPLLIHRIQAEVL